VDKTESNGVARPVRVANFSGALGDYFNAFTDAVHGEPVDVLIGDYLAEMTMARVAAGFAGTSGSAGLRNYSVGIFLRQLAPELAAVAAKGLKVVVNAGAYNPKGLAEKVRAEIAAQGLALRVAYVCGDDVFDRVADLVAEGELSNMDTGEAADAIHERFLGANAYLGGWGIAAALSAGADIVICGRVTDASLVLGPAAWWHGWGRDDWDKLAGSIVAGHVIECGPQAQGGNFAGFAEIDQALRLGFPIAEIAADGSAIITKRASEGGSVTVDTVTAQLLYEIQGPRYLNPDVVVHLDTVTLSQAAPDRVLIAGTKGSPPPPTTKVGCFYQNGFGTVLFGYATGLDVDAKIDWMRAQMQSIADGLSLDDYHYQPLGRPSDNPASQAEATVAIRISASAQDRADLNKLIQGFGSFGLGGIPGFHGDVSGLPGARVDYWPGLLRQSALSHQMILENDPPIGIALPETAPLMPPAVETMPTGAACDDALVEIELGDLIYARSGDKGANANLGVWARSPQAWEWLRGNLAPDALHTMLGLAATVTVERYELANVHGLVFVLKGYFGTSGSGNIGLDQIGKALGEFLRARHVRVPARLAA
jgi:Acyclic terpene utilisation family protein AtuA